MMKFGKWKNFGKRLLVIGVLLWSVSRLLLDWPRITPSYFLEFVVGMWPPDLSVLPGLVGPLGETLQIALVAIVLAAVISVPMGFLGARNTSPHPLLFLGARTIIAVSRAIPTLLWAILLVILIGLGPFTGTVSLIIHCVGTLGKHFYEAIEAMGPNMKEVLEAMRVDGSNELQVAGYGTWPMLAPLFTGYILARMDANIRASTILGVVGAGGIGLQLTTSIRMFRGHETLTIILAICILVIGADLLSQAIRSRMNQ